MTQTEPAPEPIVCRCERCGSPDPTTRYDRPLKLWLCNSCWADTPPALSPGRK